MGQQNGAALPGLPSENKWSHRLIVREDLMPCPFCGGAASYVLWNHPQWAARHQIACANEPCKCTVATQQMKSFEDAVLHWTNRPIITKVELEPPVELAALPDKAFFE